MNKIKKTPLANLGYDFINKTFIPEGKDEYYLRNIQNTSGINYRNLSAFEIEVLVKNGNTSDNWNHILVSHSFNPSLVKNCKFYGLVRIGKLEPYFLEFNALKVPVGLYNSTIISCDIGNNVAINRVNYMSHYIIGSEVIIVRVDEIKTTANAKFGNGIIKNGEPEEGRIWLEVCNENGGRKVIPFNGMLPGDAWLWSKFREDDALLERFIQITELEYKTEPGYYGKIGDRTVIKSTNLINDVFIGSDAYIKGATKLKNLTINSCSDSKSQIGEGCELVNGIIDYGCRIFYGVKAVRFVMGSNSQLKYGARLINSYLGSNATVSCCEVLNSLIFPAHEQHHNNSFLCAALILGQSNIPAGATIGSNHNSRSADGEVIAGRGFWPGLCVSLKHGSKFASYTILAKGDYDYELNIPFPFSLISIDKNQNELQIMPGYWMLYNMYALERNYYKYKQRDRRHERIQEIEYDYLAPDTINEIFESLKLFELYVGRAHAVKHNKECTNDDCINIGQTLFKEGAEHILELDVLCNELENSKRPVRIIKIDKAYKSFKQLILFYGIKHLIDYIELKSIYSANSLIEALKDEELERRNWLNVGGQLIEEREIFKLRQQIRSEELNSWKEIHRFYECQGKAYSKKKTLHGISSLLEVEGLGLENLTNERLARWFEEVKYIKNTIVETVKSSREKDYTNSFRKLLYNSTEEMEAVLGKLNDDEFIAMRVQDLKTFINKVDIINNKFMGKEPLQELSIMQ